MRPTVSLGSVPRGIFRLCAQRPSCGEEKEIALGDDDVTGICNG